jgi:hypothetical protein
MIEFRLVWNTKSREVRERDEGSVPGLVFYMFFYPNDRQMDKIIDGIYNV